MLPPVVIVDEDLDEDLVEDLDEDEQLAAPRGIYRRGRRTEPGGYTFDALSVDEPWRRVRPSGPRQLGFLGPFDFLSGLMQAGWGTVAVVGTLGFGAGVLLGFIIGESSVGKAVGRGVGGVAERGAHHVAKGALAALLA